jgi:hypothetical protein
VQDRVHALKGWIASRQGPSRVTIYERLSMIVALNLLFSTNKELVAALSPTPVRHGEEIDPVRVFVEFINSFGATPDRAQKQRISRDVRASRYLLSVGISPDKIGGLAQLKGEGIHAWANRNVKRRREDPISRYSHLADGVEAPVQLPKAEITIKIGRGKRRTYNFWIEANDIGILKEMLNRMSLKSQPPRVRRKRSKSYVPRSERASFEGAFDDPEFNELMALLREKMEKDGKLE